MYLILNISHQVGINAATEQILLSCWIKPVPCDLVVVTILCPEKNKNDMKWEFNILEAREKLLIKVNPWESISQ